MMEMRFVFEGSEMDKAIAMAAMAKVLNAEIEFPSFSEVEKLEFDARLAAYLDENTKNDRSNC
jgi:hypothetical protein